MTTNFFVLSTAAAGGTELPWMGSVFCREEKNSCYPYKKMKGVNEYDCKKQEISV